MLNKLRAKNLPGFTLLELVVVIVVISILAAIAIPTFQGVIDRAHDASAQTTLQAITHDAEVLYAMDNGSTPAQWYAAFAEAVAETPGAATAITADDTAVIVIDKPDSDGEDVAIYQAAVEATGAATPDTGESTTGTISVSVDEANNLIGVAYVTSSSHCAFATTLFNKTQAASLSAESWNLSANLGTNCRGTVALLGQTETRATVDTLETTGVVTPPPTPVIYSWSNKIDSPTSAWMSIASSLDGMKLIAADQNGYLHTSINAGETWTALLGIGHRNWNTVASSYDGTKLVAGVWGGAIFTSSDSGASWVEQESAGLQYWISVASDSSGTKLVAAAAFGLVYISNDSGNSWQPQNNLGSAPLWSTVAISGDGNSIFASSRTSTEDGKIYKSTNSGTSWVELTGLVSNAGWMSVASNIDGTRLIISQAEGNLFTSNDGGSTWTELYTAGSYYFNAAISPDGTHLIAGSNGAYIAISVDSGTTWTEQISPGLNTWRGLVANNTSFFAASIPGWLTDGRLYKGISS